MSESHKLSSEYFKQDQVDKSESLSNEAMNNSTLLCGDPDEISESHAFTTEKNEISKIEDVSKLVPDIFNHEEMIELGYSTY